MIGIPQPIFETIKNPRRLHAATPDHFGRQRDVFGVVPTVQPLDQQIDSDLPDEFAGNAHRRERRREELRDGNIVEGDDRDVTGDREPCLLNSPVGADCHVVVGRNDGVGRRVERQQ